LPQVVNFCDIKSYNNVNRRYQNHHSFKNFDAYFCKETKINLNETLKDLTIVINNQKPQVNEYLIIEDGARNFTIKEQSKNLKIHQK